MGRKKKRGKKPGGSPGVYVQEITSGSKPIEGVGTAVAAFVGFARRHPVPAVVTTFAAISVAAVVVRVLRN